MPANLSPEYRRAEQRLRAARTPDEKIAALEEMLRVIPKHKGTDHMQADLKARIAKLRKENRQEGRQGRIQLHHPARGRGAGGPRGPAEHRQVVSRAGAHPRDAGGGPSTRSRRASRHRG